MTCSLWLHIPKGLHRQKGIWHMNLAPKHFMHGSQCWYIQFELCSKTVNHRQGRTNDIGFAEWLASCWKDGTIMSQRIPASASWLTTLPQSMAWAMRAYLICMAMKPFNYHNLNLFMPKQKIRQKKQIQYQCCHCHIDILWIPSQLKIL